MMNNIVWISFFLTLFAGAITALIGVWIQDWYSTKKKRERLLEGLESEVRTNQLRVKDNIKALQKSTTGILIFPLESRVYEQILFEYPSLVREVYGAMAEEALREVYGHVKFFNLYQQALTFNLIVFSEDKTKSIITKALESLNDLLENTEKLLKNSKANR